ncbi:serine/threonine-protein phosphatase [Geobacter sulfurreducens]|uniref:PP2C family protein-serine/threonine phosphatase n=1 Tax=Geobacter sulfurreducens TaxID=35554 RepID=UPI001BDDBC1A|nr:SpoIIE family protein phosphatase [Geobacter sulfurreducens]QVW34188.1 serine/threonine-protein phosphatase [Geobacter sulfurreducens]
MSEPANAAGNGVALASRIQQLLLPKTPPVCSWGCIGVMNRMATALGGDYFDFISMPDGREVVFIGDVTGHDIQSSVVMSLVYGFLHHCALTVDDPLTMVSQLNRFLVRFADHGTELDHHFSSTLFLGIIDPASLRLEYVNAGHVPPLVLRRNSLHRLASTSPPVGFFAEAEVATGCFGLERGDRLLLYTDGILDASNGTETFGAERLDAFLTATGGSYTRFMDELAAALRNFGAGDPPDDDCSAIVVDV